MTTRRRAIALLTSLAALALLVAPAAGAAPAQDDDPVLFTGVAEPPPDDAAEPPAEGIIRKRYFHVDARALTEALFANADLGSLSTDHVPMSMRFEAQPATVALFDGVERTYQPGDVRVSEWTRSKLGGVRTSEWAVSWLGHIRAESGIVASVRFTVTLDDAGEHVVYGRIIDGPDTYVVRPLDGTRHGLYELDMSYEPGPENSINDAITPPGTGGTAVPDGCTPNTVAWRDRGGVLDSGTSAVAPGNDRVDVFTVAAGWLYQRTWDGGAWSSWTNRGQPPGITLSDTPGSIPWPGGGFNVYARGSDGAVWQRYWRPTSGWSAWTSLGGVVEGGIAAVTLGSDRTDVFAIAGPDRLYRRTYADGAWGPWTSLGRPAAVGLTMAPGAVAQSNGDINVFARGADGGVWHRYRQPARGWSGWESLGGVVDTGPTAVATRPGRVDVFAVAADRLYRKSYEAGWSGWANLRQPLGALLNGQPGAVARDDGRVDTFPRAITGEMWQGHHPCL